MNSCLETYAYHISIGPVTFVMAVLASAVIAAVTITHQALKAALVNPVKSLRSE